MPVYLLVGELRMAGLLDIHPERRHETAVLLTAPFGWEEAVSYRSRRIWARELAGTGHPVLRFDLPGTGDSPGGPMTPDLLDRWIEATAGAGSWLREEVGAARLAVVGLGLGGFLAAAALARGAPVDDLVLWGVPERGRSLVREMRAFARLQAGRRSVPHPEPQDRLELGGYVMAARTLDALGALDLGALALDTVPGRRALLLDRDGRAGDASLADWLGEAGWSVSSRPGPGWSAMTAEEPQHSAPPTAVMAEVEGWLAGDPSPVPGRARRPSATSQVLDLEPGGVAIRESPLVFSVSHGIAFGVLAEPREERSPGPMALLLNAGAIRHTGPNRMWVEAARRWAAGGVPTLRLDLPGLGEADGGPSSYRDVARFYDGELADQVVAVLDVLEAHGAPGPFTAAGLCSGAYWSFHLALRDPRVDAIVLVNPRVLFWKEGLEQDRAGRRVAQAMSSRDAWRRLARGNVPRERWGEVFRMAGEAAARRLRGGGPAAAPPTPDLPGSFDTLGKRGVRSLLVFADDEPLADELRREGRWPELADRPGLRVERIGVGDHTLRPLWAQRRLHALLDEAVLGANRTVGRI